MKLKQKRTKQEHTQLSSKNRQIKVGLGKIFETTTKLLRTRDINGNFDTEFKCGDIIKFVDKDGQVLEYGYLASDVELKSGMPICRVVLQREATTIDVIVTNAMQKV